MTTPFILSKSQDLEIGVVEHLDEYLPLDIVLIGEDRKSTIINLIYYRCPGICSSLMEGLADVMNS